MSPAPDSSKITYKRLPGRVWAPTGFVRAGSLWLGPDHVLLVIENGYAENYKRFFFSDIQGFVVRRDRRRMTWNLIFALILLLIFWVSYAAGGAESAVYGTLAFGVLFWLGILINSLRGPTCKVQIRTAVQTEMIGPLQRIRTFEKFSRIVRPLIVTAQGELTGSEAEAANAALNDPEKPPPPLKIFHPTFHYAFFGTLAGICLPGFLLFVYANSVNAAFYYLLLGLAFMFGLIAMVRQHSDKCTDTALLSLSWFGGTLVLANGILHYFQMIFRQLNPENFTTNPVEAQLAFLRLDPSASEFVFWQISVFLFLAWGIGMLGLLRSYQTRPQTAAEIAP